jgi:hypothetical protein
MEVEGLSGYHSDEEVRDHGQTHLLFFELRNEFHVAIEDRLIGYQLE